MDEWKFVHFFCTEEVSVEIFASDNVGINKLGHNADN